MRILIADPDNTTQADVSGLFEGASHSVTTTPDGIRALRLLQEQELDLVIAELRLPGMDGLELLRHAQKLQPEAAVILATAFGSVEDAVTAMRAGAADFLSKPFSAEQIRLAIDRSLRQLGLIKENRVLRQALDDRVKLDNMVATDPAMQQILKTVRAVAKTKTTVLITGESGTGKTLLARAIHRLSDRADGPFVEVNCGALPESLLESELFGHVRGAFTGAVKDRAGKFEAASGGTIFLDEIGTSSPGFQVKLLRVLQDRVIERVGDTKTVAVDVRVVLATNQDLGKAVRDGRFREDLFYRIHVVTVEMPPLRERRSDILHLAHYFLRRFAAETGKSVKGFAPEALECLGRAQFPGNVRQLENAIERAVVLCESDCLTPQDLPADLLTPLQDSATAPRMQPDAPSMTLRQALELPEKMILERALASHQGNRQQTAIALGINRSTLFNKMRKFGLL